MEDWPPAKAWTNIEMDKYNSYFVAINYGVNYNQYWVNLVSVIYGDFSFKISFDVLSDRSIWSPGWKDPNELNNNSHSQRDSFREVELLYPKGCFHPSEDSGLNISVKPAFVRPWF